MSADPFAPGAVDESDFEIDLAEGSATIPEGWYVAECFLVSEGMSQNQNRKLMFDFKIIGNKDGKLCPEVGQSPKTVQCALTSAAMWKLEEVCVALQVAKAGEKVTKSLIKQKAQGARCLIEVDHVLFRNRPQAEIVEMNPYTGGVEQSADAGAPF